MNRDIVLEGVLTQDLEQLRLLSEGRAVTASGQQMARIAAKGWLDTVDGVHLITLTGRTLLEKPPYNLD